MTNRRIILIAAFALLAVSPLASVVHGQESQASLQEVRVQLKWTHQFEFAGYYAAHHKGYYRDAGLDVKLIEYTGGTTPIDQLIGGRADFAVADSGALIYRSAGVPLVALAAIFQKSPSILMVLESSGIRELSDLRGKRAMLQGGFMDAELMSMLQTAGLSSDDIHLVPSDTSVRALIDGQTDGYNAYTTDEPYALAQRGIEFRSFAPNDYGVHFYGDVLLTTEASIASNPERVSKFVEATLKGWRYAIEHPEEIIDLILEQYNTQERTRGHLQFEAAESIKLILGHLVPIGYMNVERWLRIEDVFREQGQLTQAVDMTTFVYRVDDSVNLVAVLKQYRMEISGVIVVLVGLLLVLHILRLRAKVSARTRELEEAKRRAEIEARTDALTGLPNRRYFIEALTRDIARAGRDDAPLSLISLDIDYFKSVNDRYGHGAGDHTLQLLGETLAKHVRTGDMAARIGGEEFALSCPNTNISDARNLAKRLRRETENLIVKYEEQTFSITISVGLAFRESGDSVEQLLRKADQALYDAKKTGRNRVCEWCPEVMPGDEPL